MTALTEAEQRRDLAAAYRLAAQRGWDDIVWTHISASVPGHNNAYLLNRFGLRFNEITASNLVMVNVDGQVIDGTHAPINPSGFAIHGCVHRARPDAVCVLHLHSFWAQAFAASGQDLLPCSQPALRLVGRLGRHAYEGLAFGPQEQQRLVQALGNLDGVILEQHGILLIGRSVAEAFVLMHLFERAVRIQLTVAAAGSPACVSDTVAKTTYQQWVGNAQAPEGIDEWPALLRGLDQTDPDYRN
jgi:ribulose-5-phosphate 4-epimerase/fuculose-1-phosphate aldolase